jgi:hypothetical protein
MHHVDLFGLISSNSKANSTCCCCGVFQHNSSSNSTDHSTAVAEKTGRSDHCRLCDFFDQFHLMIESGIGHQNVQFCSFVETHVARISERPLVATRARGPPVG